MTSNPPIQQEQNPESYVPDGMPELKVGMRVRWRISSECDWKCDGCEVSFHAHCQPEGRGVIALLRVAGRIQCASSQGSLYKCKKESSMGSHEYQIEMDEIAEPSNIFWAAAAELIPLEPSTNLQKE